MMIQFIYFNIGYELCCVDDDEDDVCALFPPSITTVADSGLSCVYAGWKEKKG